MPKTPALIFALVLSLALILSPQTWALSSNAIGLVLVFKGDVKLINSLGEAETAKVGLEVFAGDKVTSAQASSAKIVTVDHNILVLGESSELVIEKYDHDTANKKQVTLKLNQGSIRSALQQTYTNKDDHFKVVTPIAVAGVRGTDFLTEYHPEKNEGIVCTFKGQVAYQAQERGQSIGKEEIVTGGNFIQHNSGKSLQVSPAKPAWVEKRLAAHEVKGDEHKSEIKSLQREHKPQGSGPQGSGPNKKAPTQQEQKTSSVQKQKSPTREISSHVRERQTQVNKKDRPEPKSRHK